MKLKYEKESLVEKFFEKLAEAAVMIDGYKEKVQHYFTEDAVLTPDLAGRLVRDMVIFPAVTEISDVLDLTIKLDDAFKPGVYATTIPRLKPTKAFEVVEGEITQVFDTQVESITVSPKKIRTGAVITREVINFGIQSFLEILQRNLYSAIQIKIAEDIFNAMISAAEAIGNSSTGGVSVDSLLEAIKTIESAEQNGRRLGLSPTRIVLSPEGARKLFSSDDWKQLAVQSVQLYGTPTGKEAKFDVLRMVNQFRGIPMIVSNLLTNDVDAIVIDTRYAVYYLPHQDVEVYEVDLGATGRFGDKALGLQMYYAIVVAVPEAIYIIKP